MPDGTRSRTVEVHILAQESASSKRVSSSLCISLPALRQRQAQMETKRTLDGMVEHPERVRPEQFSYGILDRIFHRHKGRGPATLEVGGLEVTSTACSWSTRKKRPACALAEAIP